MIGLKKWELAVLACALGAALTVRLLEEFGVIKISPPLAVAAVTVVGAALILWRPVCFLAGFLTLKRSGCRAKAVVSDYKTVGAGTRRQLVEIIRFTDEAGRVRTKELRGALLPKRRIGREYTLFYDPENEERFYASPQCFISPGIDLVFALLIAVPLAAALVLY